MKKLNYIGLKCISCGDISSQKNFHYTCELCGENLDVIYDYSAINNDWSKDELMKNVDHSIWRFLPLLPVKESPTNTSMQVGGTPLIQSDSLAKAFGIKSLWLKDDSRNPSGSLKDRATEVGIQHAKEQGQKTIVAASTGNAAASLACLSATHEMEAVIFAPSSAPAAKLTQIMQYGAKLFPVNGSYDNAFDLSTEVVKDTGWYSRSTGINPILSEGKKTVSLEIAEQLNWQSPDHVFVPVGDGCIIGGVYKGFYDLFKLGWIEKIPKIHAVQSNGSSAIVNALSTGTLSAVNASTIADSISVDLPRDGLKAIRAVTESNGIGIKVSDDAILDAQYEMAKSSGLFAEPAAAAGFAGLVKAANEEFLSSKESVVVLVTGTGLKDIKAAQTLIDIPAPISPNLNSFKKHWNSSNG